MKSDDLRRGIKIRQGQLDNKSRLINKSRKNDLIKNVEKSMMSIESSVLML
mgnify:CR=1 FL=1